MRKLLFLCWAAVLCSGAVQSVHVTERSDVLDGKAFGSAGPYERIAATVQFRVDPKLAANRIVRDLEYAQVDGDGMVEFSANLYVLKPRDPAKGNGTALFEVSNRGGKGMLSMFNRARTSRDPKTAEDFGDGLLLEHGFTLVWLGWQYDVPEAPGALRVTVPIARDGEKPLHGVVRAQFTPDARVTTFIVGDRDHKPYAVADPSDKSMQLLVRDNPDATPRVIPRDKWRFSDPTHVSMAAGFEPGKIYDVIYPSEDPYVAGLGLAGVRDFISFLKYGGEETLLADQRRFIKRAIGFGTSQSGRLLRHFVYDGFNADEKNRKVFDAVWPHVAGAGRGSFNMRFAQPSRDGQPIANILYPVDLFPFTDVEEADPETHVTDALLARAVAANVVPKIFYTNGSYEYWGRAASLIHITPDGVKDAPLSKDTRIYYNTGAQHGSGAVPPVKRTTRYLSDPLDYRFQMRALLMAMQAWVKDGKEPPPSNYPLVSKDQLTTRDGLHFPKIAGVDLPKHPSLAYRLDFGPEFRSTGVVAVEPPNIGKAFGVMVPQVNADGNETSGIRLPEIQVPLGTYAGWNLRDASLGSPDQMISYTGSYFPFAKTKAERERNKDQRPSIAERYASKQEYLDKYRAAANALASDGYVLAGDVPQLMERAEALWEYSQR